MTISNNYFRSLSLPEGIGWILVYNYYGYVDYYKQLKKDCVAAIKVFPRLYGLNVYRAFRLYLMKTHSFIVLNENRAKIGNWDVFYSGMLTLWLSRIDGYWPFAFLVCLVMAISVLGGALIVVRQFRGNGGSDKGLLIFMIVTVVYVSVVGNLFEYAENYRYRFLVNPFLIILSCRVLQAAWQNMFCAKDLRVGWKFNVAFFPYSGKKGKSVTVFVLNVLIYILI